MNKVDYFGKKADSLGEKKLFLFDMDGTIYEEGVLFEGTLDLLNHIEANNGRYVFITNNSSKSVKDYVIRLNDIGIKVDVDNFFTSTQATILYLKKKYPNKVIYCQGTKSMIQELKDAELYVVTEYQDNVGVVLVGFDTELTSEKLRHTCKLLERANIPFIATNPDLVCPVSFGFVPDCGSICEMLTNVCGRVPIYIGKPERTMVDIVREKFGYSNAETVVIGDRLYTDIAVGLNADVDAICVLTGEATVEDILDSNCKPSYTFQSVKEIDLAIWG